MLNRLRRILDLARHPVSISRSARPLRGKVSRVSVISSGDLSVVVRFGLEEKDLAQHQFRPGALLELTVVEPAPVNAHEPPRVPVITGMDLAAPGHRSDGRDDGDLHMRRGRAGLARLPDTRRQQSGVNRVPFTIREKVAEIKREMMHRVHVYGRMVAAGKMTQHRAERQTLIMKEILDDYEAKERETGGEQKSLL